MPGQDGYELIREVRALERETDQATPIPAIALTAYAAGEDRAKALKSGFFSHVRKPVRAAAFVRIVAESMGRQVDET
jgi:two-component system CheB/CheR fusion protein